MCLFYSHLEIRYLFAEFVRVSLLIYDVKKVRLHSVACSRCKNCAIHRHKTKFPVDKNSSCLSTVHYQQSNILHQAVSLVICVCFCHSHSFVCIAVCEREYFLVILICTLSHNVSLASFCLTEEKLREVIR